jgi:hypothetical protein
MASAKQFAGRDAILAKADVQIRELYIPEWGTWIRVRGLTGKERDDYETSIMVGKGKSRDVNMRNLRAKLVVRAVIDQQGARLFTDADVEALGEKNAAALERIFDVARELSGLSEQDTEELLKNSEGGQPADSPSA